MKDDPINVLPLRRTSPAPMPRWSDDRGDTAASLDKPPARAGGLYLRRKATFIFGLSVLSWALVAAVFAAVA